MAAEHEPTSRSLSSTLEERGHLLRRREEDLLRLRQERLTREYARLTERLWVIETELLGAREQPRRPAAGPVQDEDPLSSSFQPAPPRLSTRLCPFLASYANRDLRFDKPSAEHVCYAIGHAHWAYGPADMDAQKSVCTRRSIYPRCPRYRHATASEAAGRPPRDNIRKGWWQFWRGDS